MPIREMPAFVFSHKNVLRTVICALVAMFFLTMQFIFMKRSVLEVVFDVIVPFTACVTFGCYAITMAMDRPVILIMPSTVYFISPLIRQLIYVEVGAGETYPIIILLEMIPYVFYCISAGTLKLKKTTKYVLWGGCILISLFVVVLLVLLIFFQIMLYSNARYTVALIFGTLSILCIYIGMLEQLEIAGIQKRVRSHG
ncbi:MAG: hypothetical protein J1E34_08705 [Oscillospiraceae bacterium]|nr:hypothetical protein [Oscillospiraceae bacterium]